MNNRLEKCAENIFIFELPGLTSQRHSALISSDSGQFQICFSTVHYLKISEQRWKWNFLELRISTEAMFQRWFSLKQRWFRAEQCWYPLKQRWFSTRSEWQLWYVFKFFFKFYRSNPFWGTDFRSSAEFSKKVNNNG